MFKTIYVLLIVWNNIPMVEGLYPAINGCIISGRSTQTNMHNWNDNRDYFECYGIPYNE